jgi:hypothetical protein
VFVATLLTLSTPARSAPALDYDFVSLSSDATALSEFSATVPSVNNAGAVAFAALVLDPATNQGAYASSRARAASSFRY